MHVACETDERRCMDASKSDDLFLNKGCKELPKKGLRECWMYFVFLHCFLHFILQYFAICAYDFAFINYLTYRQSYCSIIIEVLSSMLSKQLSIAMNIGVSINDDIIWFI